MNEIIFAALVCMSGVEVDVKAVKVDDIVMVQQKPVMEYVNGAIRKKPCLKMFPYQTTDGLDDAVSAQVHQPSGEPITF